jgi:hypothetical protein
VTSLALPFSQKENQLLSMSLHSYMGEEFNDGCYVFMWNVKALRLLMPHFDRAQWHWSAGNKKVGRFPLGTPVAPVHAVWHHGGMVVGPKESRVLVSPLKNKLGKDRVC